mgnify:CR=1 FL=1
MHYAGVRVLLYNYSFTKKLKQCLMKTESIRHIKSFFPIIYPILYNIMSFWQQEIPDTLYIRMANMEDCIHKKARCDGSTMVAQPITGTQQHTIQPQMFKECGLFL